MDVRTLCTRALRRAGVSSMVSTPSAEDAAEALALLNEMARGWARSGVDILMQDDFTLDDEFRFWAPPVTVEADTLAVLNYRGAWNASTNSPALASADGTQGYVYRVTTAGSTTLDDVTSWAVDDYAVFDGLAWRKSADSRIFDGGIVAMLTAKVADTFQAQIPEMIRLEAERASRSMMNHYIKPPLSKFDSTLVQMPSRGLYIDGL